ncbi:unnamed protein product [Tilletia controversa]|nr:unnamed protein product [Tilletia controversa]
MGGGDLNMKKSWHPLLKTNQEKVWKQEKKALEERRKLDELRREREQERELQELQRLQEAAGGRKRSEKLDWMYATPSAGQGPSANELEDYLLGKKSVDKLLQQKDTPVASSSNTADQSSFMAVQNANSSRDMASKIRADPLLAIKQQEQAAYQALLKDPARLRQLQEANGVLAKIKQDEDAEAAREEAAKLRAKLRAGGGKKDGGGAGPEWDEGGAKGSFLLAEQSKMFGVGAAGGQGMDLAERVKRGKGRLEKLADE